MAKIRIGESYTFVPSGFTGERRYLTEEDSNRALVGKIAYIHPKRRFFMVEAQIQGHTIRECFKIC